MSRKPAIFLILSFLLLSIGGAMFHHHLRGAKPPAFAEVDAFLRNVPVSSRWQLDSHQTFAGRMVKKSGWWDWIGIHRKESIDTDHYQFRKIRHDDAFLSLGTVHRDHVGSIIQHPAIVRGDDASVVTVFRKNGEIQRVNVSGPHVIGNRLLDRFPQLHRQITMKATR